MTQPRYFALTAAVLAASGALALFLPLAAPQSAALVYLNHGWSQADRDFYYNTQRGNSNTGHSFDSGPRGNGVIGPLLTKEQRWALVEYLKSIPEEAGRVTPFGGPPNAVTGSAPWGKVPDR
jgi:hypothetical protein